MKYYNSGAVKMEQNRLECCPNVEISDDDVFGAMKAIPGYIDITPADFREIYRVAHVLALDRVHNRIKAGDLMRSSVYSIQSGSDLITGAELLADKGISGAPVVDAANRVIGVISEKDFLGIMGFGRTAGFMAVIALCLQNKGCIATSVHHLKVDEIMSIPATTIHQETSVAEIGLLLTEKNINRLPVVDHGNRLVGIITRSDLVRAYCLID